MIDAPIALAFTAGLVAAFNPCGFAMLPAYLSFFLGTDDTAAIERGGRLLRAVTVGAVVSAGFVLVFGLAGLAVTELSLSIQRYAPWATIVIGLLLIPLGIALLRGFELKLSLPRLQQGGGDRTLAQMFLFGISYAVVSLSCTLPVFLVWVVGTFRTANFLSGVVGSAAYAAGMGTIVTAVTVALAMAKGSLVRRVRGALAYVNRVSGALLVVAGAYVAYYGWFELDPTRGGVAAAPFEVVTDLSTDIQVVVRDAVTDIGPARLGLVVAAVLAAIVGAGLARRGLRKSDQIDRQEDSGVSPPRPAGTAPAISGRRTPGSER